MNEKLKELEAKRNNLKIDLENVEKEIDIFKSDWRNNPIKMGQLFINVLTGENFIVGRISMNCLGLISLLDGHLWSFICSNIGEESYRENIVTSELSMFNGEDNMFAPIDKTGGYIYTITNGYTGQVLVAFSRDKQITWQDIVRDLEANCFWNSNLQKDWNYHGKEWFDFKIIKDLSKDANYSKHLHRETKRYKQAGVILYNLQV